MTDPSPEVDEIFKVAAIIGDTMNGVGKAIVGVIEEHQVAPDPQPDTLSYRFVMKVQCVPETRSAALDYLRDALATVTAVIEQNCVEHLVRIAPMFETESDFLTDKEWAQGYMRGFMHGCRIGAGPALTSIISAQERV